MNVLSLFDGISCGYLALKRAGIPIDVYYASEIDPVAIGISQFNNLHIIQLGAVEKININKLPKIDLLIGGSPCQGFSRAGLGLNFEDPRSKLFFNFVDILKHLKKDNPNIKFMLENVNMKNDWIKVISDYLGVNPIRINSDLIIPQNRDRLYWTNINVLPIQKTKLILSDILENIDLIDYISKDGIKIDRSFSKQSIDLVSFIDGELRIKQSTKAGYIVAENGDGINISFPTSKSRRGRVIRKRSSCLDTACNIGVFYNGCIRRFTINELEKLQTLPINYTKFFCDKDDKLKYVTDKQRKQVIGNGWTVDVIAHIFKGLNKGANNG